MNFTIVEGDYVDIDSFIDEFEKDYLGSKMDVNDLMEKYNLTRYMYARVATQIREKHGLTRRPVPAKYYRTNKRAWAIFKSIDGKTLYYGRIPKKFGKKCLEEAIETCKELNWDIADCKKAIREIKDARISN